MRTRSILTTLVAMLVVQALAAPAWAHPRFRPDEAPANTASELELLITHGCSEGEPPPGEGEEVHPTVEVALEIPERVSAVEPGEKEGWKVETETADDGAVEVVTWLIEDGRTAEELEAFPFTATVAGDVGRDVWWNVYQRCTEGEYRWVEQPQEGGDHPGLENPAARLTLVEGAPAPPAEAPTSAAPTTEPADPTEAEPTAPGTTEPAAPTEPLPTTTAGPEAQTLGAEDEGSDTIAWVLGIVAAALVIGGVTFAMSRRAG